MLNRTNFIPRSLIQPDRYENIFNNWCAVYVGGNGREYHLEIISDYYENRSGKHIDILRRCPTHRLPIRTGIKTIKKAVEILERII